MSDIRLDKFLSHNGYASRRGIKQFLKNNEVTINKKSVRESGIRLDPKKDDIRINNNKVVIENLVYFLLNKPKGIISTSSDEFDRKNVTELIPTKERIYPVGRLDKDTHGLLLLTNDGELTNKLTHPSYHVSKKYLLKIKGKVSEDKLNKLRNGVMISDGITRPANVKKIKEEEGFSVLEMQIFEGRYRQIRRMCEAILINLIDLKRFQFGPIQDRKLKDGEFRKLTHKEVEKLKQITSQTEQRK